MVGIGTAYFYFVAAQSHKSNSSVGGIVNSGRVIGHALILTLIPVPRGTTIPELHIIIQMPLTFDAVFEATAVEIGVATIIFGAARFQITYGAVHWK